MSPPRRRGPITTAVRVVGKPSDSGFRMRGHGVWVPAFAGTTEAPHIRFIDTDTFGPFLMVW